MIKTNHFLPELENEVLAMIIACESPRNDLVIKAFDILTIECFTHSDRKRLFYILRDYYEKELSLAAHSIMDSVLLKAPECSNYLVLLPQSSSTASLVHWCRKLRDKAKLRHTVSFVNDIQHRLIQTTDTEEANQILSSVSELLLTENATQRGYYSYHEAAEEAKLLRMTNKLYISTGFIDVDALLGGGFYRKTVVTIGAPPSCGKTHFGISLLWNMQQCEPESSSVFFTMEMPAYRIADRLDSIILNKMPNAITEEERASISELRRFYDIALFDHSRPSIEYMRSKCRVIAREKPISVIMVDHLDLCDKPKSSSLRSDEKLTEIAKSLHDLSKEFNCVVIIMTQLNKQAINKASHRPTMNDSKNSNATAEVSDYWIGLKRISQWDEGKVYADSSLFEVILDKNRHGNQGIVYLTCDTPRYGNINQAKARMMVERGDKDRRPKVENAFFDI